MTLQEKRKELEKKLEYAQNSHASFGKGVRSEGDYRESAAKVRTIYEELRLVADELGDPVPVRMYPK